MKKLIKLQIFALFAVCSVNAQQEKGIFGSTNWLTNWTDFRPMKTEQKEINVIVYGSITTNTTWSKKNIYLLQGNVYIENNAILTIEPGTVIKGDFESTATLVVTKGSMINAIGKDTDPIVFTSNAQTKKPGDWGGILILGDAPINKFGGSTSITYDLDIRKTAYGGTNPQSNSGIFKYVRIEFAGKKVKGMSEYNALTLAAVGNKTVIENVMISYSNSKSLEILGGELNLNKIVSYRAKQDDFSFNLGAQANLINSLAVRNPNYSNASSRAVLVKSYFKKEDNDFTKKLSNVNITNVTLLNDSDNLTDDINAGLIKEGIYIAEDTNLTVKKSVISGFYPAVILSNKIDTTIEANLKKIRFEDDYFNNCKGNLFTEFNSNNEDLEDWYGQSKFWNVYSQGSNAETFIDLKNTRDPDYRIKIYKITAQNK